MLTFKLPLCLPFLYETIVLKWKRKEYLQATSLPRLCLFVRTIMRRPDLAFKVKSLRIEATDTHHPMRSWDLRYGYTEEDIARVVNHLHAAKVDNVEQWMRALHNGSLKSWIPLLLVVVPDLQILHVHLALRRCQSRLSKLQTMVLLHPNPLLQKISSINCGMHLDELGFIGHCRCDGEVILAFLYLPLLQNLEACCKIRSLLRWPQEPPLASQLKVLAFRNSEVSMSAFERLLQATPNLESLHYSCWCIFQSNYDDIFDPPRMKTALLDVRRSLRHLSLSASFPTLPPTPGHHIGMGSLAGFESLESLEISLIGLLGYDAQAGADLIPLFPSSLKILTLLDDGRCRISGLKFQLAWRRTGSLCFAPLEVPW